MKQEIEHLVIGAGLSGMIMGYLLKRRYAIFDAAKGPVFQTSAPFYLHSPLDWLPTTWREIDIHHNCWDGDSFHRQPNIRMMNNYARKITGKIIDTSLKFMDGAMKKGFLPSNGKPGQVLTDLYEETSSNINWGWKLVRIDPVQKIATMNDGAVNLDIRYKSLISTMPLPVLLRMVGIEFQHKFVADDIYTSFYAVPEGVTVDAHQIIYITSEYTRPYRASLMGQTIYIESMLPIDPTEDAQLIEQLWGITKAHPIGTRVIKAGKFHPIERNQRKLLLAKLTNEFDIFCLGRFAVWNYKRIDHIAHDAQQLVKIIRAAEAIA